MKSLITIFLLAFTLNSVKAQEKHFIFIQSDNKQLFNVLLNSKLYSSNASGYVIIPKLTNGDYTFTVGFSENTYPEQTFSCTIAGKDLGFNLKNFEEKGWALFNLQTLEVTMAAATGTNKMVEKSVAVNKSNKDEPISFDRKTEKAEPPVVTAPPANETVITPEEVKKEVIAKEPEVVATTPPVTERTTPVDVIKPDTLTAGTEIKKITEDKTTEGVNLSYTDATGRKTDTISVTIPSASPEASIDAETKPVAEVKSKKKKKEKVFKSKKEEIVFIDLDQTAAQDSSVVGNITGVIPADTVSIAAATPQPAEKTLAKKNVKKEKVSKRKKGQTLIATNDNKAFVDSSLPAGMVIIAETPVTINVPPATKETEAATSPATKETVPSAPPVSNEVATRNTPDAPVASVAKSATQYCNSIASDEDYMKLRRKMAMEDSDEKMIREAKKVYRNKCFTTNQIKNLSTLFLSDEGRYHFLSASYSFVSDPQSYPVLESEFIDPAFTKRFKSIFQ